tara:strand:- start:170 stop:394 length:225 start_codon:yes stop_codon:yes gene_type:complete
MKTINKMDLKDYFDKKLENSDVRQIGWRIRGEVLDGVKLLSIRDRIPMASIAEAAMREYLKVKGIKLSTDGETN